MTTIYGTLAASKTYHAERGNTAWAAASDAALDILLLVASEFVDNNYGSSFPGWKKDLRTQERQWPRYDAFDIDDNFIPSDVIPIEVERATYEAALKELASPGTLNPDIDYTARRQSVAVSGAVSVTYADLPLRQEFFRKTLTIVDAILAPICSRSGVANSLCGSSYRV